MAIPLIFVLILFFILDSLPPSLSLNINILLLSYFFKDTYLRMNEIVE